MVVYFYSSTCIYLFIYGFAYLHSHNANSETTNDTLQGLNGKTDIIIETGITSV